MWEWTYVLASAETKTEFKLKRKKFIHEKKNKLYILEYVYLTRAPLIYKKAGLTRWASLINGLLTTHTAHTKYTWCTCVSN